MMFIWLGTLNVFLTGYFQLTERKHHYMSRSILTYTTVRKMLTVVIAIIIVEVISCKLTHLTLESELLQL